MKASELRIGNYVERPSGILCVTSGDIHAMSDFQLHEDKLPITKPIPLTKEWLLKFGFTKDGRGYAMGVHQRLFSGLMKLTFNGKLQMWVFVFSVGSYRDITRVQYVHQLQNLYFALTGEELEIKKTDL